MSRSLYLQQNLFMRECEGRFIFLDIARNRYFTLSDSLSDWLAEKLLSNDCIRDAEDDDNCAGKLIDKGVITRDATQGKPLSMIDYKNAEFSVTQRNQISWRSLAHHLPLYFRAFFLALWLRRVSHLKLEAVFRSVTAWKSKLPPPSIASRELAIELTQHFHALSPFVFTTHDACFFRSLFLIRYLALHRLPADWVFAVRLSPFAAHCWVEFDHVLLNEDMDRAQEYRPIMVI